MEPTVEQTAKDAAALAIAALQRAIASDELFQFIDNLDTATREIGVALAFRTITPLSIELEGYPLLRYLESDYHR